jgi:large subunit ribosomal protein L10
VNRTEKEQLVIDIRDTLQQASVVIVTQQTGLTVADATLLRSQMRNAGAEFKVLKNTLARIAVKDTALEGLTPLLVGPTALAYSSDPVAAAKVVAKFANSNDVLKIVGGCLNGQVLTEAGVKSLATLPSLDELRSKLIGVLLAPATKLAVLSKEPAARVARVLAARA